MIKSVAYFQEQIAALESSYKGECLKRRAAEHMTASLRHHLTELRKYVGTLEDQIAGMTIDRAAETQPQHPQYREILERAKGYWPHKSDLNPRTAREEAMLNVIAVLLDECYQALAFQRNR